jgi:putative ABC transport system substrate-binding protein
MAIEYAPSFTKEYMADRCEKLGITVPEDYEAIEAE